MKRLYLVVTLALLSACNSGVNATGVNPTLPPNSNPTGPQTWQMTAGSSSQNEAFQALAFYPTTLTIDAGDTVTWSFPAAEPHTVTFLGPRSAPAGRNDPANGTPAGGTSYDGSTYTNSGLLMQGKTYALTFPKAGTYHYYCLIHGEMQGTIVVQPAGTPYPTAQTGVNAANTAQETQDLGLASAAVASFPYTLGGPHVAAGISGGLNTGTSVGTVLRFIDGDTVDQTSVTVPVGSSVTWTNLSSNEEHTVTFGIANQPFPSLNPFSPPSGGTTYDGTQVVNSGILAEGASFTLTFATKGTFTYHCLLHDETQNMIGTVIVQ